MMTYRIAGLDPAPFRHLYGGTDDELKAAGAIRMPVTSRPGYPCRVTLEDAEVGEQVLLVNHVSHDVANPYRATHAIFVTEGAEVAATYEKCVPPALDRRILSLRAFSKDGMMSDALLVQPGEANAGIRKLFSSGQAAYIHAHNAVRGCFAARVERS